MKVSQKTIKVRGKDVGYTYIENKSNTVCFMFSGAGYTYEKPLFYYSTMTMIQNQYDVVHFHYSYGDDLFSHFSLDDIIKMVLNDVNPVITRILNNKQYKEIVFLGKSLGTIPIIKGLMNDDQYLNSKIVLLTPLLKFDSIVEGILSCNQSTLIVIGDRDSHFIKSKIEAIEIKKNVKLKIVYDANHSLDIEPFNTLRSTAVLGEVMKILNDFIED